MQQSFQRLSAFFVLIYLPFDAVALHPATSLTLFSLAFAMIAIVSSRNPENLNQHPYCTTSILLKGLSLE